MRKKREPITKHDSGWERDGRRPLCAEQHRPTLVAVLDFAGGYSNTYRCRTCGATRNVSGPRAAQPWER